MQAISLKARVVLPMDGPDLDGGVVTIAGDQIVEVAVRPPAGVPVQDLGDVALLPGLINSHTHLEFSDLAEPLGTPQMNFVEWIRLVIARRSAATDPQETVARGLRESLDAGVTTVCDITTADASVYQSARRGPDILALLEVIGFSRSRSSSALAAAKERLDVSRALARDMSNVLGVGLSPHAPYTVNLKLVWALVNLAREHGLPVAMHLAESREELELLFSNSGLFRELLEERSMWDNGAIDHRSRPFDYLLHLAPAPRSLIIHGTQLAPAEVDSLVRGRSRMSLVYCPRTHSYFNGKRYPLGEFLRKGVRVVLGTDSRASSPDLSVLSEARHAAREQPSVSPYQILQMVTVGGAEALGISDKVGTISPGQLANLTAIPIQASRSTPPAEAILQDDSAPVATWYRGRRLS